MSTRTVQHSASTAIDSEAGSRAEHLCLLDALEGQEEHTIVRPLCARGHRKIVGGLSFFGCIMDLFYEVM